MNKDAWREYIEYEVIKKEHLNEQDWKELIEYTQFLYESCGEYYYQEERPTWNEEEIRLKSFIGTYRFRSGNGIIIKHNEEKLESKEFQTIIKSIAEWGAMLGPPFLKALLKILSPITDEFELTLAYSDLLLRYTETALSEYIPPIIEKRQYKAPIPLGRILIAPTISLMSRGQILVASQRTKLNFVSLPWLLLIRFHCELTKMLGRLAKKFIKDNEFLSIQPVRLMNQNRVKHITFLVDEPWQNWLNLAYEVDFNNIRILEKIRKQASTAPSISDIVTLWEAFIGRRALLSNIEEILKAGYSLKPLCKLYELWCLKIILDVLKEYFGAYSVPDRLPGSFSFMKQVEGIGVEVLYNVLPQESLLVKPLRQRGLEVSAKKRPDITITFSSPNKKITIIGDVKYRMLRGITDDDISRFMWYLLDYAETLEGEALEGIIFHASSEPKIYQFVERKNPSIRIHLLCMKPNYIEKSKEQLWKIFNHIIKLLKNH